MPSKKEVKEKPVKGDEAEDMVLQYLKSVNRPYASTDVSANLKNKVPKAAAQKIMVALSERGDITLKAYGKQTIFVYNQDSLPVLPADEMANLDQQLKTAREYLAEQTKQLKSQQSELAATESVPKTEDLSKEIERIKAENDLTTNALLPFRATMKGQAAVAPMSAEEIKKIDAQFLKWRKEWTDRRRIFKGLIDSLSDGGAFTDPASFQEDQGIEVDDDKAKEVESGEFCKPTATALRPKQVHQVQKASAGPLSKRSNTGPEDGTASKAKKAKKT